VLSDDARRSSIDIAIWPAQAVADLDIAFAISSHGDRYGEGALITDWFGLTRVAGHWSRHRRPLDDPRRSLTERELECCGGSRKVQLLPTRWRRSSAPHLHGAHHTCRTSSQDGSSFELEAAALAAHYVLSTVLSDDVRQST